MTQDRALALSDGAGRWVLAATVLGSSLAFLDGTVVNIALPAIGTDLGAGTAGLTWVVNAYTLTLAATVLLGGTLGDRFGRRRVFSVGVAWFGVTSLACAVAPDAGTLIAFRALQGIGAGLLTPTALAILHASFRTEDRSRAIGAWSGLAGLAGALGPFLGGWLIETASWRWIFLINIPAVMVVLWITRRHVPESRDRAAHRLDLGGAVLAVLGLGALTYGLAAWSEQGASSFGVQMGLGVGLLALVAFVVLESRIPDPMLPPALFRVRLFGVTNLVTLLVYAALGGVFFWLVVTLQVVAGWGPLRAGLSLLPITLLMLAFSPYAGTLGDRLGPRTPMAVGPLVAAVGVAALSRIGPDTSSLAEVLLPVAALGAGLTLTVTPLTATALGAVPGDQAGLASGVNNAVARTGGLLLVAVLPAATGLGGAGFADAGALAPAFSTAMLLCSGLLALAGLLAAAFIRTPIPEPGAGPGPACPSRHCAVDAPPVVVEASTPG